MHDALAVNDIVLELPQYLSDGDLLHLCLTCKRLHTIVIGQLWRTITSIKPLLCPAPNAPFRPRLFRGGSGNEILFRPELDWARFRPYAALVHTLVVENHDRWQGLDVLLSMIYRVEPELASFFPHLHRLSLAVYNRDELEASLPLLLLPLNHLTLHIITYYTRASVVWPQFMDALVRRLPELLHFELVTARAAAALLPSDVMTTILACLSKCRFVRMEWIDPRMEHFVLLAELPNVIHMHIGLSQEICDSLRDGATVPSTAFSKLSTLGLNAQGVLAPIVLPVLQCVSSTTLSALHFQQWDLSMVLKALPLIVSKWAVTLKELHVRSYRYDPSAVLSFDDFRPLLSCSAMEVFELTDRPSWNFKDEDIEAMAMAWPNLKVFSMTGGSAFNGHRKPSPRTLSSFIWLARHCPKLQEIALDVNFDEHVPLPESAIPPSPLVILNVGARRCPVWLIGYLRKFLFPNMQTFLPDPERFE